MDANFDSDSLAMWFLCEAIGEEQHLINELDFTRGVTHDVKFIVDGVELNFLRVINKIDEQYAESVRQAAGRLYTEQCDERAEEIKEELDRINNRLKEIRRIKFPEINWEYD